MNFTNNFDFDDYHLLGDDTVWLFGGSYRLHQSPTSLCLYKSLQLRSVNLLALVHPEDGGDTILRNVGSYKSHTVSSPRRW
jgi:hypothetical protein